MSEKFEREIEELLSRLGEWVPRDTPSQRFQRILRRQLFHWQDGWQRALTNLRSWRAPLDQLMLGGLVLVVLSYLLRFVIPMAARYIGVLGVILFFTAFALSFSLGRQHRREFRWRGRVIQPPAGSRTWWERVRRWILG